MLKSEALRSSAECLTLAHRANDKALHTSAARLGAGALEADPKLAEDRKEQLRHNAACSAALAGSGQGKDDPAAKAKLREQARDWLKGELTDWSKFLASKAPQSRVLVVQTL